MKEVMQIEVHVGQIPHTAEPNRVTVTIKSGWPAKGARYDEYRALKALIPQELEVSIPAATEFDGWEWILPAEFLSEKISAYVSRYGVDVKELERVNTRIYRATIVTPSWWKPPSEEEEESEPAE